MWVETQSRVLDRLRCEVWHDVLGSQSVVSGWSLGSAAVHGRVMRGLSSQSHLLVFIHSHMTKRSQGRHNSCVCVCQSQRGLFKYMICVRKKRLFVLCVNVLQDSSGFSGTLLTIVYCLCLFCGFGISFMYLTCFLSPVLSLQEARGAPSTTAPDKVSEPIPLDKTHKTQTKQSG